MGTNQGACRCPTCQYWGTFSSSENIPIRHEVLRSEGGGGAPLVKKRSFVEVLPKGFGTPTANLTPNLSRENASSTAL